MELLILLLIVAEFWAIMNYFLDYFRHAIMCQWSERKGWNTENTVKDLMKGGEGVPSNATINNVQN